MERSKDYKVFGILCIMVSIIAVSFAYASLTHTLKIKSAVLKASPYQFVDEKWDIVFKNISKAKTTGFAREVVSPSFTSATSVANFEVAFTSPGDSMSYTFDVVNQGTIDAAISAIQSYKPTCVGSDKDCKSAKKYIKYKVTYDDGSDIKIGDILYSPNNEYLGFNSRKIKVTFEYSGDIPKNEIPVKDVLLKGFETVMLFEQSYNG